MRQTYISKISNKNTVSIIFMSSDLTVRRFPYPFTGCPDVCTPVYGT